MEYISKPLPCTRLQKHVIKEPTPVGQFYCLYLKLHLKWKDDTADRLHRVINDRPHEITDRPHQARIGVFGFFDTNNLTHLSNGSLMPNRPQH